MITAFTASTFFPKPLSRAGKRVKASMQKPFYHAFTTFTDTLQIDAYSNRFHLPPEHITRQHKVPKVRIRQFNYYSKKHIDAAFAKYEVDSDLTEWYTPEDIQEKYGMTRVAIRSHVYRNNIPSKKEHGQIFYSKLHFDLSKNSAEESKAEYYTVKEAMEKFKLSRDSVYNILQFHQIPREKNGRFVRFLKVDFYNDGQNGVGAVGFCGQEPVERRRSGRVGAVGRGQKVCGRCRQGRRRLFRAFPAGR